MLNTHIQKLINILLQLPNLSENNARKIALSMIRQNKIKNLSNIINTIEQKLSTCICGNIDELIQSKCNLCIKKNEDKILIILSINDLFTIENSGIYEGKYNIICSESINLTNLRINELIEQIQQNNTKEIILALSYHYLSYTIEKIIIDKLHKTFEDLIITKIQTGMPAGGNIHNETESTLKAALMCRQEIDKTN